GVSLWASVLGSRQCAGLTPLWIIVEARKQPMIQTKHPNIQSGVKPTHSLDPKWDRGIRTVSHGALFRPTRCLAAPRRVSSGEMIRAQHDSPADEVSHETLPSPTRPGRSGLARTGTAGPCRRRGRPRIWRPEVLRVHRTPAQAHGRQAGRRSG